MIEVKSARASMTRPVTSADEGSLRESISEKGILFRKSASFSMSNAALDNRSAKPSLFARKVPCEKHLTYPATVFVLHTQDPFHSIEDARRACTVHVMF